MCPIKDKLDLKHYTSNSFGNRCADRLFISNWSNVSKKKGTHRQSMVESVLNLNNFIYFSLKMKLVKMTLVKVNNKVGPECDPCGTPELT